MQHFVTIVFSYFIQRLHKIKKILGGVFKLLESVFELLGCVGLLG